MKKLIALLSAAIICFVLGACGEEPNGPDKSERPPTESQVSTPSQEEKPEDFEPVFDLYTNTVSDEAKTKAAGYPAVDGKLPDWKGTHIADKAEFAWPWVITVERPEDVREKDVFQTEYDEITVQEIAQAGYNFVRVAIDTRFFFTAQEYVSLPYVGFDFYGSIDTVNESQYLNLDQLIEWCIQYDLHVCLDVHSTYGGLMIGGDEEASRELLFTPGSDAQAMLVRFWEIVAKRYADIDTNALSFNIYNEPPSFVTETEEIYIDLMNRAIDVIQAETPNRLIFVDGLNYSHVGPTMLDELHANNLVIGFHFYSEEVYRFEPGEEMDAAAGARTAKDELSFYNNWAKDNGVRWMLMEYGCTAYPPQEQQLEYYRAVVDLCKEFEVPRVHWAFNVGDFGICIWGPIEKFVTPGAEYEDTGFGHRINTGLRDITTE